MSVGESPRSYRWARTPSVAPKNDDFQDSLSWRVAPVKNGDVWSGDPDVSFIDMACQVVLRVMVFTGFGAAVSWARCF